MSGKAFIKQTKRSLNPAENLKKLKDPGAELDAAISPFKPDTSKQEKAAKDAEALANEQRMAQKTALAELDEEENRRIKKIISGSRGTRSYRGGPMFRGRASNKAGAPTGAASAGSASPSAAVLRDAGTRGGLARSGYRSLLP